MAESTDRSVKGQAESAGTTAGAFAGNLASEAGQVGGTLIPHAERDLTTPPGLSPADLATMQQRALETAGGVAGTGRGMLATRAARLRNPAGVTAGTAAAAEGASRSGGKAVEDILSQNALIKEKQREQAQKTLEGVYGTDIGGAIKGMGLQTEDINAELAADKTGWFQNTMQALQALGSFKPSPTTV